MDENPVRNFYEEYRDVALLIEAYMEVLACPNNQSARGELDYRKQICAEIFGCDQFADVLIAIRTYRLEDEALTKPNLGALPTENNSSQHYVAHDTRDLDGE